MHWQVLQHTTAQQVSAFTLLTLLTTCSSKLTLSCTVSKLQTLQHTATQRVSSFEPYLQMLLTVTLSCIVAKLQTLQHTMMQPVIPCTP